MAVWFSACCSAFFSVPCDLSLVLAVFHVQEFIYGLESGSFLQDSKPLNGGFSTEPGQAQQSPLQMPSQVWDGLWK